MIARDVCLSVSKITQKRMQFIHYTRAGHIASAIVNIVIIVTGT